MCQKSLGAMTLRSMISSEVMTITYYSSIVHAYAEGDTNRARNPHERGSFKRAKVPLAYFHSNPTLTETVSTRACVTHSHVPDTLVNANPLALKSYPVQSHARSHGATLVALLRKTKTKTQTLISSVKMSMRDQETNTKTPIARTRTRA
jgi:hypothetical protein